MCWAKKVHESSQAKSLNIRLPYFVHLQNPMQIRICILQIVSRWFPRKTFMYISTWENPFCPKLIGIEKLFCRSHSLPPILSNHISSRTTLVMMTTFLFSHSNNLVSWDFVRNYRNRRVSQNDDVAFGSIGNDVNSRQRSRPKFDYHPNNKMYYTMTSNWHLLCYA
jgi:hypothetical protein